MLVTVHFRILYFPVSCLKT